VVRWLHRVSIRRLNASVEVSKEERTMKTGRILISLGVAVAASKLAKMFSHVSVDDMLDKVGLERSRSHAWERMALLGAGALAGAGAALLLAPGSGRETRERIGEGLDRLATKASDKLHEMKSAAPELERRQPVEHARAEAE
jgi:hypothetical protein